MTRAKKTPPRKIVVSSNRPQIRILSNGEDFLQLTIPGVSRQALALAHAIVCAFLCDISDEQNLEMLHEPRIAPGDRLLSCLVVTIELARPAPSRRHIPTRVRLPVFSKALHEAARRACTPLYGGQPAYEIIEVAG